jgi:hypothetical protein
MRLPSRADSISVPAHRRAAPYDSKLSHDVADLQLVRLSNTERRIQHDKPGGAIPKIEAVTQPVEERHLADLTCLPAKFDGPPDIETARRNASKA